MPVLPPQTLFAGVPDEVVARLLGYCSRRYLHAGDILLEPGQLNRDLFLLLDGRLEVHIERVRTRQGFAVLPGECVGEISTVDGKPASAYVIADAPSEVLVVPEHALWEQFLCIPVLNRNFMRMFADRFRSRNETIRHALEQELRYEYLTRELEYAREIQAGLLPREVDLGPGFDVAAEMTAARQIGGDFYDAFVVGQDEHCIAIGDVAGKSIPAALLMVRAITLLRTELPRGQPLELAVSKLNRALCEENPTYTFLTLVVGLLNRRTRQFRYVNAGHHPILLGERGMHYRPLPLTGGIPIGIEDDARFDVETLSLATDDVLLLYTDGVTEAMNPQRQQFGADRLLQCLTQAPARSAAELSERVMRAVHQFVAGAPQSDDLTTLILRCREAGGDAP